MTIPSPPTHTRWTRTLLVWTALVIVAAYVGYQHLFSTFAAYDDEGYVMISLRSFMDGQPLYDQTFSQYGPAFYGIESGFHGILSLPVTHDVTRVKTLGTWLLVAGMCAFFVSRLAGETPARRRGLSLLCFCLVFLHLDRLCLEPGHPQELCALGVAGCLVISLLLAGPKRRQRVVAAVCLGVICGVVLLTKTNVGLFLVTGMVAAFVLLLPEGKAKTWLCRFVCVGLTALPLLLYRQHLLDIHASSLGWVTAAAAIALFGITRMRVTETAVTWWELICLLGTSAATVLVILAWTLANGTSTAGLAYGMVTQHVALQQNFFHPAPVMLVWVLVGFAVMVWSRRSRARLPNFALAGGGLAVLVCLLAYFRETWIPLTHGLHTRGQAGLLMSLVPGLLGLLIVARPSNASLAPRVVLACVALLQPLSAFPTPGTQTAVGTFALLVVCVVLMADGLAALADTARADNGQVTAIRVGLTPVTSSASTGLVPWQWTLLSAVVVAAIATLGLRGVYVARHRAGLEPLALPGAQRLRLEKDFVRRQHWLVNQLRRHADTFVFGEHGQNSLYFWSEMGPPTSLNTTFWPFILRECEQQRIVNRLSAFRNPCVVRTPFDAQLPSGPLARYIDDHFEEALSDGETAIWVRKAQPVNVRLISGTVSSERRKP